MYLTFLVANNCYVFTFGSQIVPMDGIYHFDTRKDAIRAARSRGMNVSSKGKVSH